MTADTSDTRALRDALGSFATGVTVVTTLDRDGAPWGFTANSFTSVSLDPPLVLVCLTRAAVCCPVFMDADAYAVNILAEDQRELSATFASACADQFADTAWRRGVTGSPIVDKVVGWLDCRMHNIVDGGDHVILIGQVVDFAATQRAPLGYCRGAYVSFGLTQDLLRATRHLGPLRIAAVVEHDGALLMARNPDTGNLELPSAPRLGAPDQRGTLVSKLSQGGIEAPLFLLFAVYDDSRGHNIVYRGQAPDPDGIVEHSGMQFIAFDDIDWDCVKDAPTRRLLERYIRERREDTFGVHVGSAHDGTVQILR